MAVSGKVITLGQRVLTKLKIHSSDHPNLRGMPVSLEQLPAKTEESLVRQAIVFENDCAFYVFEYQVQSLRNTASTAKVFIS